MKAHSASRKRESSASPMNARTSRKQEGSCGTTDIETFSASGMPSRLGKLKRMKSAMRGRENPILELSLYLVFYKALLLGLALISSTIGAYDSSSTLLEQDSFWFHWDAVYFSHIAREGYVFEQEFAFGPLLPALTSYIHPVFLGCFCHHLAVIALYKFTLETSSSERIAKLAALLLIVSPAGIFLCIGYTEPLYAALSMTALSIIRKHPFLSAALFGMSGLVRATGVLNALYFLPRHPEPLRFLKSAIYALIVCTPFLLTQAYAYYQYCPGRPWCGRWPPFIYAFVQDHYWNVGFGRYFTLSNIPLFIISAPMYLLCFLSLDFSLVSVQQGLLTFITFTTAHAQIITRMSSGFPRVYQYLAKMLVQENHAKTWNYVVVFFVMYGMIQAVLFGAFLPPA